MKKAKKRAVFLTNWWWKCIQRRKYGAFVWLEKEHTLFFCKPWKVVNRLKNCLAFFKTRTCLVSKKNAHKLHISFEKWPVLFKSRSSYLKSMVFLKRPSMCTQYRYRSRQYYESKVLHSTEVNIFSTDHSSQKSIVFIQICNEYRSPVSNASFDTLKAEIGRLFIPQ